MNAKRILIADDEPHVLRVIELFLRREGYEIEAVRDGQQALESILRRPPDLLITDVNMPRMTGTALCLELKKQLPGREFRIIVIASMAESEPRELVADMPGVSFIEKPLSMRSLVAMLAKLFATSPAKGTSSDA